jgi:hypothetical protein
MMALGGADRFILWVFITNAQTLGGFFRVASLDYTAPGRTDG